MRSFYKVMSRGFSNEFDIVYMTEEEIEKSYAIAIARNLYNFCYRKLTVSEINRDYRNWIARRLADVGEDIHDQPRYFDKMSLQGLTENN